MILKHEPCDIDYYVFYTIIISVYSKANSDDTEFNVGEMLKKKKFMNINEWKNKFSGAYMTIPACSNWQDWNQFAFLYPENGLQIWRKSVLLSLNSPMLYICRVNH